VGPGVLEEGIATTLDAGSSLHSTISFHLETPERHGRDCAVTRIDRIA
jgi:hypothetical protein